MNRLPAGLPPLVAQGHTQCQHWIEIGFGPKAIPHKQLTAVKLAAAIETAVSDPHMRQRAAELGQRIQQEDGIANAVALIEQIVFQANPPS